METTKKKNFEMNEKLIEKSRQCQKLQVCDNSFLLFFLKSYRFIII